MMKKEEQYIEERFGHKQLFKVPDGYFDRFADRMMEQLPEQAQKVVGLQSCVRYRIRTAIAAAAVVLFAVLAGNVYLNKAGSAESSYASTTEMHAGTFDGCTTIEQAAYYSMLDNEDIYTLILND